MSSVSSSNDEDWVVEIRRPGVSSPRYIRPAVKRIDMQKWCNEFNREVTKSVKHGPVKVARLILRIEMEEDTGEQNS